MDPDVNQYVLLVFYSDDVFKIGTRQAGVSIVGKYRIENDTLYLFDYNTDKFITKYVQFATPETEGVFNFTSDNVAYAHELLIGGTKFFPWGSDKENGDTAIVNGYDVIVDKNKYVFNDTVRFRTRPTTDSDCIKIAMYTWMFEYNPSSKVNVTLTSFKKGSIVYTLAKTVQEECIDGKTAPWYYIVLSDGFEGVQYGWVFGAYFDEYVKEKESYYWEMLRNELGLNDYTGDP